MDLPKFLSTLGNELSPVSIISTMNSFVNVKAIVEKKGG
ncbi:hypothetical protein B0H94_103197 [Salsuginibacillus halophilus]|uniref:Uncharacterized protein n=1 Tax=Salsuginibacillus halophilus TaxID=517424 RepID=A0A2P8HWN5_9BACI|nr:hypothetical protein B0H94_103197 [Salsuginibacillus halophilus]